MKETRFIKNGKKKLRDYNIVKLKCFLKMKLSVGSRHRRYESVYEMFNHNLSFDKSQNYLPYSLYYKPTDIIIYDIVSKSDLAQMKKGLMKLYRNCFTHKYLTGSHSESDIDSIICGLDQTLHNGDSWYNIGLFDFANDLVLDSYIERFEVRIHNFSSSYAAVGFRVVLSKAFQEEILSFIHKQFVWKGHAVHRQWIRNNKKSGAKIGYAVSTGGTSEYAKCSLLFEQLDYIKEKFLREICKYFPLIISKRDNTIGTYIFETNITPGLKLNRSIYSSLGLYERFAFFLSNAERLYYMVGKNDIMNLSDDMIYLYNPDCITDYEMYHTPNNKVVYCFLEEYMRDLYRAVVLKNLGLMYQKSITKYRNETNRIKSSKFSLRRLLKLRNSFSIEFYDFKKIDEEIHLNEGFNNIQEMLNQNDYVRRSTYYGFHNSELITAIPRNILKQVKSNMIEIDNDLQRKIEISTGIVEYQREGGNRRIAYYSLFFTVFTFIILLYPSVAVFISGKLNEIWLFFMSVLSK